MKTESHIFNIYEAENCIFMQETAYLCKCYRDYAKIDVFNAVLTIFLQYERYINTFREIQKLAKNSPKQAKTAIFVRNVLIISSLSHLRYAE